MPVFRASSPLMRPVEGDPSVKVPALTFCAITEPLALSASTRMRASAVGAIVSGGVHEMELALLKAVPASFWNVVPSSE